jgi:hypothetical protein
MIDRAKDQNSVPATLETTQPQAGKSPANPYSPFWKMALVLLPLLAVGLAVWVFLTSPLHFVQPERGGETPPTRQIGQSFKSEFGGLHSITLWYSPEKVTVDNLRLHLREPGATNDLRLVQTGEKLTENRVRFEFPALDKGYQDRSLLFLLEGNEQPLEVGWYPGHDVYPGGESFLDGVAQPGDLTFELDYNPDPAALLDTYFKRQQAYNGPAWAGLIALLAWLGLAVAGIGFLVIRGKNFSSAAIRQMRPRQFWLVALYFLALGACGGLGFMFMTPPLQGLDEQGHLGRVVYSYQYDAAPDAYTRLYQAETDLQRRARYLEYIPGFDYDQSPLDTQILGPLSERYQPPVYYAVAGGLVRLGAWLTGDQGMVLAQYMARLASLLFGLGGLAVALGWVYYLRKDAPWLLLAVPATFAMLPTYLFITGVSNNDNAVNFFVPLTLLCLTVLYKEGYQSGYRWGFWRQWWAVAVIGLGSIGLALESKHTSATIFAGLAAGIVIYACFWLKPKIRLGLLLGLGGLILVAGIIVLLKSPSQMVYVDYFFSNPDNKNQLRIIFQVLVLTFESFWCSIGWVNFSDVAEGRLMLGLFVLGLIAVWGLWQSGRKLLVSRISLERRKHWTTHLALAFGLAILAHLITLTVFRIFTTLPRSPEVLEFPQGRFFLQGLLASAALFFGGLRAVLPRKFREKAALWPGFYLWSFGLLLYSLAAIFGGFLPYYYNLY